MLIWHRVVSDEGQNRTHGALVATRTVMASNPSLKARRLMTRPCLTARVNTLCAAPPRLARWQHVTSNSTVSAVGSTLLLSMAENTFNACRAFWLEMALRLVSQNTTQCHATHSDRQVGPHGDESVQESVVQVGVLATTTGVAAHRVGLIIVRFVTVAARAHHM